MHFQAYLKGLRESLHLIRCRDHPGAFSEQDTGPYTCNHHSPGDCGSRLLYAGANDEHD